MMIKEASVLEYACPEALAWLVETDYTLPEAWLHCEHAAWMLWLLDEFVMEIGWKAASDAALATRAAAFAVADWQEADKVREVIPNLQVWHDSLQENE